MPSSVEFRFDQVTIGTNRCGCEFSICIQRDRYRVEYSEPRMGIMDAIYKVVATALQNEKKPVVFSYKILRIEVNPNRAAALEDGYIDIQIRDDIARFPASMIKKVLNAIEISISYVRQNYEQQDAITYSAIQK